MDNDGVVNDYRIVNNNRIRKLRSVSINSGNAFVIVAGNQEQGEQCKQYKR